MTEIKDIMFELAEGNPGALRVMIDIVERGRADLLPVLREQGLRGAAVWTTYRDENGGDLDSMMMNLELLK